MTQQYITSSLFTFDAQAQVWLMTKPAHERQELLDGLESLLRELPGVRGHMVVEQGETPEDIKVSIQLIGL